MRKISRFLLAALLVLPVFGPGLSAGEAAEKRLIDQLTDAYGLTDRQTDMGIWQVTEKDGHTVAFQDLSGDIKIYVGDPGTDPLQYEDIVLYKMDPSASSDAYPIKLREVEGLESKELAEQYAVRTPPGKPQTFILNSPAIRDNIPKLSSAVSDISIYETPGIGVYLFAKGTTAETIDADLKLLLLMADALQKIKTSAPSL